MNNLKCLICDKPAEYLINSNSVCKKHLKTASEFDIATYLFKYREDEKDEHTKVHRGKHKTE